MEAKRKPSPQGASSLPIMSTGESPAKGEDSSLPSAAVPPPVAVAMDCDSPSKNGANRDIEIQKGEDAAMPKADGDPILPPMTNTGNSRVVDPTGALLASFIQKTAPSSTEIAHRAIDEIVAGALSAVQDLPTELDPTNHHHQNSNNNIPSEPGAYAMAPIAGDNGTPTTNMNAARPNLSQEAAVPEDTDTTSPLHDAESGLAVAKPVRFHEMSEDFLPHAEELEESERQTSTDENSNRKKLQIVGGVFLLAVLVAMIGVVAMASQQSSRFDIATGNESEELIPSTETPSTAPTMVADAWAGLPESTILALEDPMTPQSRAYEWIMNDPNRSSYPDWKVLQRFALAAIYYSTGGEEWNLQKDWLSYTVDECSWYFRSLVGGVEDFFLFEETAEMTSEVEHVHSACSDDGQYLHLVFTENNMYGTLPPELSMLDSLKILEVGANENLYGSVPSEIGLMTSLKRFYTDRNQHTGQIPTELGRLSQLEELDLSNNLFTGFIPSEIGNMEALSFLNLRYCYDMTGTLPTELYKLTNMVTFQVQHLEKLIGGELLPAIGLMTNLEYFNVHHVPFKSSIPTEIGLLSSLRRLNLWKCSITGTLPSELFQLTNMWRLDIDDNEITGTIPTEFGLFTDLTMAWMNGNSFSGTLPASILDSWGQLSFLKIHNNNLDGSLPSELGQLTSLKLLWLSHNQFFGTIPSQLGLLNNVTELFLHGTNISGTIPETLTKMDGLEMLTVSNTSLTGSIPNGLCDRIWDMTHTCNVYFGGMWIFCEDVERANFTCSSTSLCGCDACGPCNTSTIGS
ncbi:leucine rich repeat [Seminavis robusta]|uniref:Leucine rich repeat n=1 Tax=Seminavis robusta TaxID=568900 RepID=A0A9N8H5P3_9STRA|nr:leucine rich repeat [Seminavis robusta]|eukprot:Sro148_g068220.1 leucine rich repeat (799) ;mRNA; r:79531-82114